MVTSGKLEKSNKKDLIILAFVLIALVSIAIPFRRKDTFNQDSQMLFKLVSQESQGKSNFKSIHESLLANKTFKNHKLSSKYDLVSYTDKILIISKDLYLTCSFNQEAPYLRLEGICVKGGRTLTFDK